MALVPRDAPRLTRVGFSSQSASLCSTPPVVALGYMSFMNDTLWPTKTSSSMVTPSQMKV